LKLSGNYCFVFQQTTAVVVCVEVGSPLWLGPDPARYGGGAGQARWRGTLPQPTTWGLGPEDSKEEGRRCGGWSGFVLFVVWLVKSCLSSEEKETNWIIDYSAAVLFCH